MPEHGTDSLFVIGAGAMDHYLPIGVTTPEHTPGGKIDIANIDQYEASLDIAFEEAQKSGLEVTRKDIVVANGGNGRNLAVRARKAGFGVRFLTVHGKDEASDSIRADLLKHGIDDVSVEDPRHIASRSYMERAREESDRSIHGLPRGSMGNVLTYTDIRSQLYDAGMVAVASLKSHWLNDAAFRALSRENFRRANQDTNPLFVTFLPGSSEYKKNPHGLLEVMAHHRPNLLAGNETEYAQLLEADDMEDYEKLAHQATKYAEYAVCTAGLRGIFIARQGYSTVVHAPAIRANALDTTGGGDSVAWTISAGLRRRQLGEKLSLERLAHQAAQVGSTVVQYLGATGDIEQDK